MASRPFRKNHIFIEKRYRITLWNFLGSSSSHQSHDIPSQTIEAGKSVRRISGPAIYDIKLTYAVLSFPTEVQLCTSSIPGHQYGVCAKLPFPVGTWIGPYEGQRVKPSEMSDNNQSRYMWEVQLMICIRLTITSYFQRYWLRLRFLMTESVVIITNHCFFMTCG